MYIKDIIESSKSGNRPVNGTYVLSKYELKSFRGKPGNYIQCELVDKSGSVRGMIWDRVESIQRQIKKGMVVDVSGESTRYNDAPQIIISLINESSNYDISNFLPSLTPEKKDHLFQVITNLMSTIDGEIYKHIWNICLISERISTKFKECPGGIGDVHHSYLGGLIEHTLSVIGICNYLSMTETPEPLDRDLTLTGALIHDIGKIESYNWSIALEMSDAGRLLHHTTIGYGIFKDIARDINLSEKDPTFLKLAHIIISHHENEGHREAMFPEAHAVSKADALDAQLIHSLEFIKNPENKVEGSNWTSFCKLTNRYYYKGS